ncbi:MAG: MopE-related protein [Myxococcota bacterium]|nr:MopE-related protein [Myxococcota bacterium]
MRLSRILLLLTTLGCRAGEKLDGVESTDSGSLTGFLDADSDGYESDEDCDDANSTVNPSAEEICDGVDNNCDGSVDEGVSSTFYADTDADGFGDAENTAEACEVPAGYVATGTDCNDTTDEAYPGAGEQCDDIDNDCDGEIDEELIGTWYADGDSDSFGDPASALETCDPPAGYITDDTDCDDTEPAAYPGGVEVCDEVDNNCDGETDEGVTTTYYQDTDGDSFGISDKTTAACDLPTGYATAPGDCDDTDAAINPDAEEICDGEDNDCDGDADSDATDRITWYADSDTDGFGDASSSVAACEAPSGYLTDDTDCDDTDAAVNPDADEVCNEIDDDCDGDIDTDATDKTTYYADSDGDGYGGTSSTEACDLPSGYADNADDCDDGEALSNPGEVEVCDSIDNDCDGDTDEGVTTVFYDDADGDGFGDASSSVVSCEAPSGYLTDDTDCDDTDAAINPDADEPCGSGDLDCDGAEADTCTSCLEALDDGASTGDGLYTIDHSTLGEIEVYCDMSTDGGGWTLLQRTVWDWSESSLLLTDYSDWYAYTLGDPDVGSVYRMAGEGWGDLNEDLDHLIVITARDSSDGSDCDPLYYIGTAGTLSISSTATTSSSWTSSVTMMNASTLATTDTGSSSCVNSYDAVPWFYSSCCTTCPTFASTYWLDEAHPMASYLDTTADEYGYTDADVCPSGAAIPNDNSSSYEGANVMEYLIR